MNNPVNLPEPALEPAFQHLTGYTHDGKDVEFYLEQELDVCYVSIQTQHIGYLQFNFDPVDWQDAKSMFIALCEVRSIIQEN